VTTSRVAILSWRDLTHPDGGGSEVYVESLASGLAERGHQVTLVCARHGDAARLERRDGFEIRRMGGRLTVYPRALLWAWRQGRRLDVVLDVINALPFATPLLPHPRVIGLIHHVHREQWRIIYPGLGGRLGWFVESWIVPRLYRRTPVVTVSGASRDDLVSLGFAPERLHVVHNGTAPAPAPLTPRSPSPRLAVLARLVPHKRIEEAVDLTVELRREFPDLVLDVIGDGWWAEQIQAHIARRGAQSYATCHGHVSQQQRSDLLAGAWLLVVPSVKEGWCLAIMEAAQVGTPAIAYRAAGGPRESIVDGETGWLVDSYPELRDRVREILTTGPGSEHAEKARAHARTFTWDRAVERFEAVAGLDQSP
jgi:glycosyltransferase involved in cell wall biosynthesis